MVTFRLRLGGGNGMEWKGIKKIILEYSSILLFESFNGGNGKFISLFWEFKCERIEWVGGNTHSFLFS